MVAQTAGQWFHSKTQYGDLFHAALIPAQENSGKLVMLVKQQASQMAVAEGSDLVLVDGPPGVGCPMISAISGADLVLIVTEPTAAGVHDLRRALEATNHFEAPAVVCINKADINTSGTAEIASHCLEQNIQVVGTIPFDPAVTEAMVEGLPVTLFKPDSPASIALNEIWSEVISALQNGI